MNGFEYYRKEAGLSQREAAEKIGVCQSTVSLWETGEGTPRVKLLKPICELYGCTLDQLLEGTAVMHS